MSTGSFLARRTVAPSYTYTTKVDSYTFLCHLCSVFWDLNTVGIQNTEKYHRNFSFYPYINRNCVSVFYVLNDDADDDVDVSRASPFART